MKISIFDENFKRVLTIENLFISCLWVEGYNTTEQFTLELRPLPKYKEKIKEDYFVARSDRDAVMVVKEIKSDKDVLIVSGFEAKRCLSDVAFLGKLNAGFYIDRDIAQMYNRNNGNKLIKMSAGSLNDTCGHQISNVDFQNLCESAAQSADVGYRVVHRNGGLHVEFYKPGTNKNAVFSEAYGNLTVKHVIKSNENEKNVIIVLGEGNETARKKVVLDLSKPGELRKELIVDARDLQRQEGESLSDYESKLYARGVEKYLEHQAVNDVSVFPSGKEFGEKYDLGDIVKIILSDYNTTLETRIVRFQQIEHDNQTATTVEIGKIKLKEVK